MNCREDQLYLLIIIQDRGNCMLFEIKYSYNYLKNQLVKIFTSKCRTLLLDIFEVEGTKAVSSSIFLFPTMFIIILFFRGSIFIWMAKGSMPTCNYLVIPLTKYH